MKTYGEAEIRFPLVLDGGEWSRNKSQNIDEKKTEVWEDLGRQERIAFWIIRNTSEMAEAARVRFQVRSCGICDRQSGTGAGFLRVIRFPLPILIPPTALHSYHLSSVAGTIGQIVTDVPSGLSRTPPQEIKTKN
jgi:hypothetical protein